MNSTRKLNSNDKLPLLGRWLRLYLKSRLRGSTRLTYYLANRVESLQHLPLDIPGCAAVYVDLRKSNAHQLLMASPYTGLWRELDEVKLICEIIGAGDIAFDIGANIGLHSIVLSKLVGPSGKVYAFEPNSELFPALTHTINRLSNTTLYPIALSNKDAEFSMLFVPPDDTVASLADWKVQSPEYAADGPSHAVACSERTLDALIEKGMLPQPDFIKCDVEGAEFQVFQGGQKTLNRADAPLILFEVNKYASRAFNSEVSAAMDFLAALEEPHFQFFAIQPEGKLAPLEQIESAFLNVLAVPRSKLSRWPQICECGQNSTKVASKEPTEEDLQA